jgi:dihydroorotase
MSERFDLLVRGGTVVGVGPTRPLDIGIRDGRFAAIADPGTLAAESIDVLDATGLHILPGVIDGHVHFREPGFEHKEDWATGSLAAVMGGVTVVLDMPNTQPPTRSAADAQAKAALAGAKSRCDFGLFGLADAYLDRAVLAELIESGLIIGLKVFLGPTTGGLNAPEEPALLQALAVARNAGLRTAFHAEDAGVLMQVAGLIGDSPDALSHLDRRPAVAEVTAIDHVGSWLEGAGAAGHICHLSSSAGLEAIERWRQKGIDITCEVSAQHCFLGPSDYGRWAGLMKANPPVRGEPDASALLDALANGRIDCVVSDHAPHAPGEKGSPDINEVLSGIIGVETTLRLFLTAVHEGRLTLERLVDATSAAPARVWSLRSKGSIEVGHDADVTIVDLAKAGAISAAKLHGKHKFTPFDGRPTVGAPVATVVRGQVAMRNGEPADEPPWGRLVSPG